MRVLFAGSPSIAVPSLEAISSCKGIELAGVLTNPDAPRGRHGKPVPTEVGEAAEGKGFPILKPARLDAEAREQVTELKPDLLVSFAYGRIFGPKFLALFPLGGINIHPSLLPKYRGPSPVQAAILNLDSETGITIQKLAPRMDSGDILCQESLKLSGKETAGSLSEVMAQKAALLLPEVLANYASVSAKAAPQDHVKASYCALIQREDALIDWNRGAAEIEAKIRAFNPWPLCHTIQNGKELSIIEAGVYKTAANGQPSPASQPGLVLGIDKQHGILVQTGEGILCITRLQYQAKKALFWRDFLNGARDFPGSQLG
jgi:methionyl-tRNA formyltransferase